ncbi:hypothetical protein QE152_g18891 [Popillia japonica]|uniref:Uncharacterized protein n=1 Tax=Popillia japonica TaxID=7064 RepID=A0AAW1L589_POPJA
MCTTLSVDNIDESQLLESPPKHFTEGSGNEDKEFKKTFKINILKYIIIKNNGNGSHYQANEVDTNNLQHKEDCTESEVPLYLPEESCDTKELEQEQEEESVEIRETKGKKRKRKSDNWKKIIRKQRRAAVEQHRAVNCCICTKSYNSNCVNATSAEARKIHSTSGFSWTCATCLQAGNAINGLKSIIVVLQENIKSLEQKILALPQPTASSMDIECIIQEISEREKRKSNIIIFGSNELSSPTKADQTSADTDLVRDIFGSNELSSPTKADQTSADTDLVRDICSTLELDNIDFKTTRLGKYDSNY